MKRVITLLTMFLLAGISVFAQVGINDNNTPPDNSAMLDVKSSTRGFLPPRMTTGQMNSITTPSQGLLVYNITVNSLFWFNGSTWKQFNEPYMESDPVFTAHPAYEITVGNIGNWNTAFGWGNHATAGYLTSNTETDPIFGAHPASGITVGIIGNWNAAYGWGNHAAAGYLTSYTETDPIFGTHPASGITAGNIGNWNASYGWGNHALAGYLTSFTETDPIFGAHPASGITVGNIGNWNTAYGWGNHAAAGYLTSYTETDPIFGAHPASEIIAGNITNWNSAYTNRILSAAGTAPLTLSISSNQLSGSIAAANSTTNGYLTSANWNTFNNKQNALTFGNATSGDLTIAGGNGAVVGNGMTLTVNKGNLTSSDLTISGGSGSVLGSGTSLTINKGNLTEATSAVLTISGGTGSVLGSGVSVQVKQSGTSQSGYLSNTDWNTFNNKQSTLTFGNLTSTDITVSGGTGAVKGTGAGLTINKGNLTSDDITVTGGSGSVLGTGTALTINKGNITSPDMTITGGSSSVLGAGTSLTINKGNLTETGSSVLTIAGGGNAVLGSGASIQVKQSNTSQSGYLSSGDWNSFNNKVSSQWVTNGQDISYNTGKVGIGTSAPENSAALEVKSTSQGFLPPRMTIAQRDAISSPADGLMIYCIDCPSPNNVQVYSVGKWYPLAFNRFPYATNVNQNGNSLVPMTLTGTYNYSDSDLDPQGISTFKWYRADNSLGLNEVAIAGAIGQTYTTSTADTTKYIRFSVIPAAQTGATPGDEVKSLSYTGPISSCGVPFIIYHVAGSVAPVTKSTTYGTVTNIPGELTKCWITSNLGSDHQATSVSDATEASAGWYWQFNRKQGYKHDGTTRTPNTTWITSISETSDWITANDPCNIELGNTWHLPTYTEWYNVDNMGGWTTWTGPWNSDLKLHGAGYLYRTNGSLNSRGSYGGYFSNAQLDANNIWGLFFGSGYSNMANNDKAYGYSARCVRD